MQLYDKTGKNKVNPDTLASLVTLENGKTVEEVLKALPTNQDFKLTQVRYYASDSVNKNQVESIDWDSWVESFSSINLASKKYVWAQIKTQYGATTDKAYCIVYVRPVPSMIYNVTRTFGQGEDPDTYNKSYLDLFVSLATFYFIP